MKSKLITYNVVVKSFVWPLILLIAGVYFVPLNIVGIDLSKIPGDMGDARFNNYILEHGYRFLIGEINDYWNAHFLHPYPNVIALSDNLLGTLPLYSFFRILGENKETSLQLWLLSLFILNFTFCYIALYKWTNNSIISSAGAYIFAFGIYQLGQYNHLQVFPKFIIPLVFYWLWKYLSERRIKYFFYIVVGTVFQFYCAIYLGFFLFYGMLFFILAFFIVCREWDVIHQFTNRKLIINHLLILLFGLFLIAPLILPYVRVAQELGTRPFEYALTTIPKIRSHFFTTPAPKIWNFLYNHSAYKFPDWWNHFLFVGGLPWIAIIISPIILFKNGLKSASRKILLMLILGFILTIIFALKINDFTLYKLIFKIPGFSSMRSIDRIINVQVVFFILIFIFVFKELSNYKYGKYLIYLLPLLVVVDNLIDAWEIKRIEKSESIAIVNETINLIKSQPYHNFDAIIILPDIPTEKKGIDYFEMVKLNINTMLASQELKIKTINGYTGVTPDAYYNFFLNPQPEALIDFCKEIDYKPENILVYTTSQMNN